MGAGLEGTNREWFRKQNEYDLLCRMQDNLINAGGQEIFCPVYVLTGDSSRWTRSHCTDCKKCIANWLNEKHS